MNNKNLEIFTLLTQDSVKEYSKEKATLTYLPWSRAWELFKLKCPDATYKVLKNEKGLPYFADETGIMVYTEVTVNDLTYQMWLPVMDGSNKAMKLVEQTLVKTYYDKNAKKEVEKKIIIPPATMFDINRTVMRCLVKNLAMFGLGLHIYEGEDLSIFGAEEKARKDLEKTLEILRDYVKKCKDGVSLLSLWTNNLSYQGEADFKAAMFERLHELVDACPSIDDVKALYRVSTWAHSNQEFVDWCSARKNQLKDG